MFKFFIIVFFILNTLFANAGWFKDTKEEIAIKKMNKDLADGCKKINANLFVKFYFTEGKSKTTVNMILQNNFDREVEAYSGYVDIKDELGDSILSNIEIKMMDNIKAKSSSNGVVIHTFINSNSKYKGENLRITVETSQLIFTNGDSLLGLGCSPLKTKP